MKKLFVLMIFLVNIQADILTSITETKALRVCIWPEYYGISYIDPRTQIPQGVDVELAYEFANELGVKVEFVQSSFSKLVSDVTSNKCDIAMFAIGRTPQRMEHLKLTTPHLSSDIYAIATKSNNRIKTWDDIDKKGVVVAVAQGTYHVAIMQNYLKNATLLVVDSLGAREQEVESGRADVFMTDYPFGIRMLAQRDWAKLIKPPKTFHLTPYGWAMAKHEEAFLVRVEKFIKDIKSDGRLYKIAKKYALDPIIMR